jgi:hypothetical protein
MAIKIKAGQLPSYGRITMPKGTYLSNPATAASGGLGGPQGANPPGMSPVGQSPVPQINLGTFSGFLQNLFNPYKNAGPSNALNQFPVNFAQDPLNPNRDAAYPAPKQNPLDQFIKGLWTPKDTTPTSAFQTPSSPTNNLVGTGIGSYPSRLDMGTLQQILPGKSFDEIRGIMQLKGYEWIPEGSFFGRSATPTATAEALAGKQTELLRDNSGRVFGNPYEIGPTLAPGERAVTAGHKTEAGTTVGSGIGVTGGTPYTDKEGNTVAQYAVSYGFGGDRWKYNISQDREGNWVRTYYRTFSKARSRSALKRKQNIKAQNRGQQQPQDKGMVDAGNQLVNLRANFG